MTKIIILMGISFFVLGCGTVPGKPSASSDIKSTAPATEAKKIAWRKAQEDDIYEAVLRSGLKEYGLMLQEGKLKLVDCTFFLIINQADPSDGFMERFRGEKPVILKDRDKETSLANKPEQWSLGKTASIRLKPIQWENDNKVKVTFKIVYIEQEIPSAKGRSISSSWLYEVVREDNRWVARH